MSGSWWPMLSPLDARVLRATDAFDVRRIDRVAWLAGCSEELAASSLRRLRRSLLGRARRQPPDRLAAHPSRRGGVGAHAVMGALCDGRTPSAW